MALVYFPKIDDLSLVRRCNEDKLQLPRFGDFSPLHDTLRSRSQDIFSLHVGFWILFGKEGARLGKTIQAVRSGTRRVADLESLGLGDYKNEKNMAFFIPVLPDIGNGQPSLEFIEKPSGFEVVVRDPRRIVGIENVPRYGGQISPKDYIRLTGTPPTSDSGLYLYLCPSAGNFLLQADFSPMLADPLQHANAYGWDVRADAYGW